MPPDSLPSPKDPGAPEGTLPQPATTGAKPTPIARAYSSMVFFLHHHEGELVPLACYNAETKSIQKEAECLALLPARAMLAYTGGRVAKIGGPTEVECGGNVVKGILAPLGEDPDATYAVWPESAWKDVRAFDWTAVSVELSESGLPPEERKRVAAAVRAKAPKITQPIELAQAASVDLDGDGKEDKLYSVIVEKIPNEDSFMPEYEFSGLFLANGQSPETLTLLRSSNAARYQIRAALDLDGDKASELWMAHTFYEEFESSIAHLKDGKLEPLGTWGCGA